MIACCSGREASGPAIFAEGTPSLRPAGALQPVEHPGEQLPTKVPCQTLDAFVLEGGWPQFVPQAHAQLTDQYMDRIKSKQLVPVVADTLPPQIAALK